MTERRAYSRHGLNALKARVNVRGFGAIDRRTVAARDLLAWRKALVADLGGEGALSAQQRALVDLACRSRLLLDHVDGWLLAQRELVLRRRRELVPVLAERTKMAEGLTRVLVALGLARVVAPMAFEDFLGACASQGGEGGVLSPPERTKHQTPGRTGLLPAASTQGAIQGSGGPPCGNGRVGP